MFGGKCTPANCNSLTTKWKHSVIVALLLNSTFHTGVQVTPSDSELLLSTRNYLSGPNNL